MKTLSISDVRNHLPSVIDEMVQTNEPVVVERYGKPVASIVPFTAEKQGQERYPLRGQPCYIAPDFDEPMPDLWQANAVAEEHEEYTAAPAPEQKPPRES